MGNDASQLATTLGDKEVKRLRNIIKKEYPSLGNLDASIIISDIQQDDHPIVCANERFYEMTQYTKEEILGFNCRFLQGKHTNPRTVDQIRVAIKKGQEMDVEILNYRKNGEPFLNCFYLAPLRTKSSTPDLITYYIAIHKDVTYLKREIDPTLWQVTHLALWLEKAGYEDFVWPFVERNISGPEFLEMTTSKLKEIGITDSAIQINLVRLIELLKSQGPGFVYDFTDLYKSSKRERGSNGSSLSTSVTLSSDHSPSCSFDEDDYEDINWRKKLKSNSGSELYKMKVTTTVVVECCLWDTEENRPLVPPIELHVTSVMPLFHFKKTIRHKLGIPNAFHVFILVNDLWKRIISQQTFESFLTPGRCFLLPSYSINKSNEAQDQVKAFVRVVQVSEEEFQSAQALLVRDLGDPESLLDDFSYEKTCVEYMFLIPEEIVSHRAMMFDSLKMVSDVIFCSVSDIWSPLIGLPKYAGSCFVIPCTSHGEIISDSYLTLFHHREQCEAIMEQAAIQNGGEIPVGSAILAHYGESFIILAVMSRRSLFGDTAGKDTYYTSFRKILFAVDEFNRNLSNSEPPNLPTILPASNAPKSIAKVLFPMYFEYKKATTRYEPEAMKFAYQVHIAIASFFRWKKCTSRYGNTTQGLKRYRRHVENFETQLKKNNLRYLLRHKQRSFVEYIGNEKLSHRGLLDDEEISWLIETCAFSNDAQSPFALNHRLQRLGFVCLSALLTDKHFKTGDEFQMNLRAAVLQNKACLDWLLKIASSGSISLCAVVSMDSIGRKVRFASGATSTLYRATWENGEAVSVKLYNSDVNRCAILHEITLMSLLKHPNVLPVYAWGLQTKDNRGDDDGEEETSTRVFSVSPYAEKQSLFHVIRENPREFTFHYRFKILLQICQGLYYLHNLCLIHRDIKSLNIFVDKDYHIYIGDIGDTRIIDENMTRNIGTVQWMPPEMFSGKDYSQSSDIYSLGMVLYELITGEPPFKDVVPVSIPAIVLADKRPPFPKDIAKPWEKLVTTMWNSKQKQRPPIADVLEKLIRLNSVPFTYNKLC